MAEEDKEKSKKPLKGFKKLDELILKPFFIHDYEARKPQIKEFKKLLKLNSPEYKGGQFTGILNANARQTIIARDSQITDPKNTAFSDQMAD